MSEPGVWIELHDRSGDGPDDVAWRVRYDEIVLVPRVGVPGVTAGRRARGVRDRVPHPVPAADPVEIVLYELGDIAVTRSEAWQAVGRGKGVRPGQPVGAELGGGLFRLLSSTDDPYRPPHAEILHGGFFEVPERYHEEFNAWYELEHIREQLTVPGYLNVRRFQGVDDPDRFVALYDVVSLESTESTAASGAMRSGWGDRVRHTLVKTRARRLFRVERVVLADADTDPDGDANRDAHRDGSRDTGEDARR